MSIRVSRGTGSYRDLVVVSCPAGADARSGLTKAEEAVLRLLLAGHGNGAIARKRSVSARTVANQVAAIFRKLGVCSRIELAARCAAAADGG
jgi:DNA-binding NarL/FixJ family response regulator